MSRFLLEKLFIVGCGGVSVAVTENPNSTFSCTVSFPNDREEISSTIKKRVLRVVFTRQTKAKTDAAFFAPVRGITEAERYVRSVLRRCVTLSPATTWHFHRDSSMPTLFIEDRWSWPHLRVTLHMPDGDSTTGEGMFARLSKSPYGLQLWRGPRHPATVQAVLTPRAGFNRLPAFLALAGALDDL